MREMVLSTVLRSMSRSMTLSEERISVVLFNLISSYLSDLTCNTKVRTLLRSRQLSQVRKRLNRSQVPNTLHLVNTTNKITHGKKCLLSQVSDDQLLFTELCQDLQSASLLFSVSIQLESGHSGSPLDKLSYVQFLKSHLNMLTLSTFISTNLDTKPKLIKLREVSIKRLQRTKPPNGITSSSWASRRLLQELPM